MRLPKGKSNMREAAFKEDKWIKRRKVHAHALTKKKPNFSEDWIEEQESTKVNFHSSALIVEEWGTMLQNFLIRK